MLLSACVNDGERAEFTVAEQAAAAVPDIPNARVFADARTTRLRSVDLPGRGPDGVANYLSLSGGGAAGAYGAGFLVGLSESGERPDFDLVTGISAGALIAPFAFLGSDADETLTAVFTSGIAEDLDERRSILRGLVGRSVIPGENLERLVARFVDEAFVARVAARHRVGARLFVITTNLDAQRAAIWDMGRIAMSDAPDRVDLFRDVLVASASIPGVFPAKKIEVKSGERRFSELHADGASVRSIFLFPDAATTTGRLPDRVLRTQPNVHAIVNSELDPTFEVIGSGAIPVAARGLSTVLKYGARDAVSTIAGVARGNSLPFSLSYIDRAFATNINRPFATDYMRELFGYGRAKGRRAAWRDRLPVGRTTVEPED